jgi:hypothetical protein
MAKLLGVVLDNSETRYGFTGADSSNSTRRPSPLRARSRMTIPRQGAARSNRPTIADRMRFRHAPPDNMSFAVRVVMAK